MSNLKEKIKNVLPGSHHKESETTTGMGTNTGQYDTSPTIGTAGHGVVGEEREGAYECEGASGATTGIATTTTTAGEAATCGRESFAKVEDRPIVMEQKEYIKEHRPVEKEFVTETRFVGEREMAEGKTTEVLGQEERIIAQAQPKSPCE